MENTNYDENQIEVPYILVEQPLGSFYVAIFEARDLNFISSADKRQLSEFDDNKSDLFAEYMGIQRPLDPKRKREIEAFVRTKDASFPNAIIVAIKSRDVVLDTENRIMKIPRRRDVATIIDGQHRLSGFDEPYEGTFQLISTIFLDLELEQQAYIFATINTKHVKINPSLAKDLLEFSRIETPEKIAHNIAKKFNLTNGSPWHRKIKMLGRKDELSDGIITQHTFTDGLLNLIYDDNVGPLVRKTLTNNNNDRTKLSETFHFDKSEYPLWDMYVNDEDGAILQMLWNFFECMQREFPVEWGNKEFILTKTTGYGAMMMLLKMILPKAISLNDLSKDFFYPIVKAVKRNVINTGRPLNNNEYPAGEQGKQKLTTVFLQGEVLDIA